MTAPSPLQRPCRVFISSTAVDLATHRKAAEDIVVRLQLFADDMEHFGARPEGAIAESVAAVDMADIYIGIVAWRYGTIKPGETRSIAHIEYDEAKRMKIPCLIFLADPATEPPENATYRFPADQRDPEHEEQLRAFRKQLEEQQVVDYFTTPDNLAWRVACALFRQITRDLPRRLQMPRDLPPRAVGFVGRERETAQLREAVRQGQSIGISAAVAGMGGVGKSTLAAEVVAQLAADLLAFPGGISWVRCDGRAGLAGQVWVYDQILTRWRQPLAPQELEVASTPELQVEQREQALRTRLARLPGQALLLLDNVEAGLPLTPMLDLCAELNMVALVTSRNLPASHRLRIASLNVLEPEAAVALFVERYQAREGVWEAARDQVATLAVVETLGCLPLAIELAAARAARLRKSMPALAQELREPDVLGKLQDRSDPLAGMRVVLQKSLETLTPAQRARFAALSLPAGADWPYPVILALLEAVPSEQPDDAPSAEDDLDLLVTLSLVTLAAANEESSTGGVLPQRVRLHPLLRALAHEEWQRQDESTRQAGVVGLLDGVGEFVQDHEHDFAVLQGEEEMIAEAIRAAARQKVSIPTYRDLILRWRDYLYNGGHWQLYADLLLIRLQANEILGHPKDVATAYRNLGELARDQGRFAEAKAYLAQSLAISRKIGDNDAEIDTLLVLGTVAMFQLQQTEVIEYYTEALAKAREIGDRRGECTTLLAIGVNAFHQGEYAKATEILAETLSIAREIGEQMAQGVALMILGLTANAQGQYDEAAAYLTQSLVVNREVNNHYQSLEALSVWARSQGHYSEAAEYLFQSLTVSRELGNRNEEGTVLFHLGYLAELQRKNAEAEEYYLQSLNIARELGNLSGISSITDNLYRLGGLAKEQGQLEEAKGYFTEALSLFTTLADPRADDVREALAYLQSMSDGARDVAPDVAEEPPRSASDVVPIDQSSAATSRRRRWFWQRKRSEK